MAVENCRVKGDCDIVEDGDESLLLNDRSIDDESSSWSSR